MAMVKGARRQIDFYFQRGRQVARNWPKKSNLIPTPAQKIQRDNFRYIETTLKSQGEQQRRAWQLWTPPNSQSWVDFVHRIWMAPAHLGTLFTVQDWQLWKVVETDQPPARALRIVWDASAYPNPRPFRVVASEAEPDREKWRWRVFDYKVQRGQLQFPRWAPALGVSSVIPAAVWDPLAGYADFPLPAPWSRVNFAAVPVDDGNPAAILTACHFATL